MSKDIAIIGLAGRFPDARNVQELHQNLRAGKDSVRPISQKRIKETTLNPSEYMVAGYLEDVDKFDYELFHLSFAEAREMSPAQRLLLETVYETVNNAAYNIDDVAGSNTSVFVTAHQSSYFHHADEFTPTLMTGNSQAFLAAQIARYFKLHGNSVVVDTACSASLVALHAACNELILEDADQAVVCAINLNLIPYPDESFDAGMRSPDGKSRAFSSRANGMSNGELVASVLLKPLQRALDDRDIIHAVIKAGAVNNNAERSSSLTAPDSVMQAKVITRAWQKAGISPLDLGYIEAHGSGTQLGDTLEIEGLNRAFQQYTNETKVCPISTIKSNFGHGILAAGMAGLFRTIISLKKGELFPTVHFDHPNPMIDFDKASVFVCERLTPWPREAGKLRLAGVTALGRSGTNSHFVLEEAPATVERESVKASSAARRKELIVISSQTSDGLERNIRALIQQLRDQPGQRFSDVSYTLKLGRKHYQKRFAGLFRDGSELLEGLNSSVHAGVPEAQRSDASGNTILVLSDQHDVPDAMIEWLKRTAPHFDEEYTRCLKHAPCKLGTQSRSIAFQVGVFYLLKEFGVAFRNLLSIGSGKLVSDIVMGGSKLSDVLKADADGTKQPIADLQSRVDRLVARETSEGPAIFVELGLRSEMMQTIKEVAQGESSHCAVSLFDEIDIDSRASDWLALQFYLGQIELDWHSQCKGHDGRRIELPPYQFAETRCWIRDEPRKETHSCQAVRQAEAGVQPVVKQTEPGKSNDVDEGVRQAWKDILQLDDIRLDADFFELGGDSLQATKVINRLAHEFCIDLSFEDIFDYTTIRGLSEFVESVRGTEQKVAAIWKNVLQIDRALKSNDNFFELGGHSLLATQVLNRIHKMFRLELDFEHLYEHPCLGPLASYIDGVLNERSEQVEHMKIPLAERRSYYPASASQKRMYLLHRSLGSATSYNTPIVLKFAGRLDHAHFENTFKHLIVRHAGLRTSLHEIGGSIVQTVHQHVDFRLDFEAIDENHHGNSTVRLQQRIAEFVTSIDMSKAPMFKARLLQTGENEHVLMFDIHHAISDIASIGVFIRDFVAIYNNQVLEPLEVDYHDYSVWQDKLLNSKAMKGQEEYWLETFSGDLSKLDLPTDYPRPDKVDFAGAIHDTEVDQGLTQNLKRFAFQNDVTLYMLLLAGFSVLLGRFASTQEVRIAGPVSGRKHYDLENMVGIFLNTIVFRTFPEAGKSFSVFLSEVKETVLQAQKNQVYPFEHIIKKLNLDRESHSNPLYDVAFNSQTNYSQSSEAATLGELTITPIPYSNQTTTADIEILLSDNDTRIHFSCSYRKSLFRGETIEYLLSQYVQLLTEVVAEPHTKIKDFGVFMVADAKSKQTASKIKSEEYEVW